MHIHKSKAKPEKFEYARHMRKHPTVREREVWQLVRRKALGPRIHRQHIIAGYIVDFWCPAAKLAIEVDGPHHATKTDYDRKRDGVMQRLGIRIEHFSADLPADVIVARTKQIIEEQKHEFR